MNMQIIECVVSLASALYVCGAVICRMRHPATHINVRWRLLHVAVFTLAGWLAADALSGLVEAWSASAGACLAVYVFLTRKAWETGVPKIASPSAAKDKEQSRETEARA